MTEDHQRRTLKWCYTVREALSTKVAFLFFVIRETVEATCTIMPQSQLIKGLESEDNGTHPFINRSASTHSPMDPSTDLDNAVTFLIGFGILVLFMLTGIMASVFLCVTLKKDQYLWEVVFDGGPTPPEGQQPCQEPQSADAAVWEERGLPAQSTSDNNRTFSTDNSFCYNNISVESYNLECHRNADAFSNIN
jgi:hypothetical protein